MEFLPTRIERRDCNFTVFENDNDFIISGRVKDIDTANQIIADLYHYLWYVENIASRRNVFWFGKRLIKNPLDLWIYQEIFYEVKPDLVIETGTYHGGSSLYFASLLDILDKGVVITIDIERFEDLPQHPRIKYLTGSSTDKPIIEQVESWTKANVSVRQPESILIILDSLHSTEHVLKELNIYSKYVTKDSYIIVEDTNLGGNPITIDMGAGPKLAVQKFLRKNRDFIIDKERERFRFTHCPGGFLKKV